MLARINRRYVPAYWDDFFNDNFFQSMNDYTTEGNTPAVNVAEDEKEYRIEIAVPGLSKKEVKIDLENDVLTISSERKEDKEEQKSSYMRREFLYNQFKRSFQLPETVDQEKIHATHEAGIVTIELPKKQEMVQKAPKQIAIK
nr:putative small heat shock protein [uncultured bacterium]